jgi:hypothetical protein
LKDLKENKKMSSQPIILSSLRAETGFYVILSNQMTWNEANQSAIDSFSSRGELISNAHLVAINDVSEQISIAEWLQTVYSQNIESFPIVPDGGGVSYAWLGGSDALSEGNFTWTSNESFEFQNWGNGAMFSSNPSFDSEPDNYNNQDSLAIALQAYPFGATGSNGYGAVSQWNDIDSSNQISSVFEFNPADYRVSINGSKYAFDFDGNAGTTAKILGAFLGSSGIEQSELVSVGLGLLDGGMTYEGFLQAALDAVFETNPSGATLVNHFYGTLTGQSAPQPLIDQYGSLIDNGTLSPVSLAMQVAENELNIQNIDLVGLSATGIEYI